jgi:hypothetical protein
MITIRIVTTKLSDGSEVFDLDLFDSDNTDHAVRLQAATEADCVALASALHLAIEAHTNETVELEEGV